jgi:hypothetical protein
MGSDSDSDQAPAKTTGKKRIVRKKNNRDAENFLSNEK